MRPVDEPGAPDLEFLSLYEFLRYWRVELAAFPRSEAEMSTAVSNEYQAVLTPSGVEKVREAGRDKVETGEGGVQMGAQMKAGVDYVVKECGSYSWVEFPWSAATEAWCRRRGSERAPVDGIFSSVHASRRR